MMPKVSDDELRALLAKATPGPWRYEPGGGHAYNSMRGRESVQVHGWPERRNGISNASYSDRICENLGDTELEGPAANARLIALTPDMARELLASRRVVDAVRHWLATSALVSDEDCELEAVMTAYEDAMIRATVEQARRKREGQWPDYGLQITPLGGAVSDGYRDDGTGTEDWGVTRITDQITAWPGLGCGPDPLADFGRKCQHGRLRRKCEVCEVMAECIAIETRLRTTAEALRAATTWAAPMRDAPKSARPAWFDDARAVLAQLEKDGLA